MKIPTFILAAALTVGIALEAWTLSEVVNLKVSVAALTIKVETLNTSSLAQK